MAATESLREVAQTRAPLSTWFGIVLLFALFGIVVLAIVGPSRRGDDYEKIRAKKRVENLKTLREEEDKTLTTYAWGDKTKGTVHIPIDRAMELAITELSAKKPAPAGPIATPPPPAPAQPPAAPAHSPAAATAPATATQPGANATPAASPRAPSAQPAISPSPMPSIHPAGSPLPVRGKETASPTPS